MWGELRTIGRDLPGDIRVVVVRGEGRAFSAGLDLSAVSADASDAGNFSFARVAAMSDDEASAQIAEFQGGFGWLRRPDLVSVAAVRGHAIGAGFQLALACDMRICTEDAQFTMAEVALGLVPDLGGTKRLVELVGYARALDICITGRRVGSAEAERIGLATIAPEDDLDKAVATLTAQVLAASRDAVVEIKALLLGAAARSFGEQETAEREAQVRRIRDIVGQGD
jgi:enoyl-CoA hydratase/carnithine racemase